MKVVRQWYSLNKAFVLFVVWSVATYMLPSALFDERILVLNISAYVLQVSGLIITIEGLLSVRSEFGARSIPELISDFFVLKPIENHSGSGTLLTFKQTVLDKRPVIPIECLDRDEGLNKNIAALFECINHDRVAIEHLLDRQKETEEKIRDELGPKIGEHQRRSERVNLHGSGLALVGLLWVGIGMTQSALSAYLTL